MRVVASDEPRTNDLLVHVVHAGGEREVEDVDAMMHELYYDGSAW